MAKQAKTQSKDKKSKKDQQNKTQPVKSAIPTNVTPKTIVKSLERQYVEAKQERIKSMSNKVSK